MHKALVALSVIAVLLGGPGARADGRDEDEGLYLAAECYFGFSPQEGALVRRRGIPIEEMPVVLFLASRARVPAMTVVELRLGGRSWMEISRDYQIGADVFYVPAEAVSGPYEATYRRYQSRPQAEWNVLVLEDQDIVNLVELRFLSEHYGNPPEEIIALRARGDDFRTIHRTLRGRLEIDAEADADFALAVEPETRQDYDADTESYFQVTEKEVTVVRERGISDAEMPVALYLASQARVAPSVVVDLRLRGLTWMEITRRYSLGADIYHVPVKGVRAEILGRSPYGRAYGYYRERPRSEWGRIVLSDQDVVNLVNLRVVSERYGVRPEQVISMRNEGKSFASIYGRVIVEKRSHGKVQVKVHERKVKVHERKAKGHERKAKGHQKKAKGHGKKKKGQGKGKKHHDDDHDD